DGTRRCVRVSRRYRVNEKLQLNHSANFSQRKHDRGFVNFDSTGTSLIGTRLRRDLENIFTAEYTFTNKIALSFRARHYWSRVAYSKIEALADDGYLVPTYYDENHDINFNAFNIDCVFRWRFAPGSDIFIVWKNAILTAQEALIDPFFDNLRNTFDSPQTNSLSIRILYFLDYQRLKRK
ncbi:MAG: DUF5916 domain-containing protein, partial [Bacteroidota bacterium]